jgi:hypothetical protein
MDHLPYLKEVDIWRTSTIKTLSQFCKDSFSKKEEKIKSYDEFKFRPSILGLELIKIYLLTND